jgi:hypothetical protein
VQEGQLSLMKKINRALITGAIAGISTGVLMAYINWEATGRQGKLTEYIASSLLFSSLITISSLAGVSLGFTSDLRRKLFSKESH